MMRTLALSLLVAAGAFQRAIAFESTRNGSGNGGGDAATDAQQQSTGGMGLPSILRDLDINMAIKQLSAALGSQARNAQPADEQQQQSASRQQQNEEQSGSSKQRAQHDSTSFDLAAKSSLTSPAPPTPSSSSEAAAAAAAATAAPQPTTSSKPARSAIKSARYRSRATSGGGGAGAGATTTMNSASPAATTPSSSSGNAAESKPLVGSLTVSGFSQPFDGELPDAEPALVVKPFGATQSGEQEQELARNHHQQQHSSATREQRVHQLQPQARALSAGGPGSMASASLESPSISYASYGSHRAPMHQHMAPAQGADVSSSSVGHASPGQTGGYVLDEPTSYGQDNLLDFSVPPSAAAAAQVVSGRAMYAQPAGSSPAASVQSGSRMRAHQHQQQQHQHAMAAAAAAADPYFALPPSMAADYYGGASSEHEHAHPNAGVSAYNYSSGSPDFSYFGGGSPSAYVTPAEAASLFGSGALGHHSHSRSRWTWPWADAASNALAAAASAPMQTAATFKKHYHHHYEPHHHDKKHHDEHHHHHDELEHHSKWEHGISFGEIACIAIAVVLGIIVLGSPFFILFSMLFNGGTLGAPMGLLAPPANQAAGPAAGRRRRRKRALDEAARRAQLVGANLLTRDELERLKALDLHSFGSLLYERIGPMLSHDKLMSALEHMVKINGGTSAFSNILNQLSQAMQFAGSDAAASRDHKHVEMRRKRK